MVLAEAGALLGFQFVFFVVRITNYWWWQYKLKCSCAFITSAFDIYSAAQAESLCVPSDKCSQAFVDRKKKRHCYRTVLLWLWYLQIANIIGAHSLMCTNSVIGPVPKTGLPVFCLYTWYLCETKICILALIWNLILSPQVKCCRKGVCLSSSMKAEIKQQSVTTMSDQTK